jgi:hypothetical protein
VGCRKNQANLTYTEKTALVNALLQLKHTVPSMLHQGDLTGYTYGYVEVHMNVMILRDGNNRIQGWAHRGPAFSRGIVNFYFNLKKIYRLSIQMLLCLIGIGL